MLRHPRPYPPVPPKLPTDEPETTATVATVGGTLPACMRQGIRRCSLSDTMRRKASSFEEYWLGAKAWERLWLTCVAAQALVNAGFLVLDDLNGAHELERATIPRIGRKSLAVLYRLMGR